MAKAIRDLFRRKPPKAEGGPNPLPAPVESAPDADQELDARLNLISQAALEQIRDWEPIGQDGINYVFGNQLADVDVKEGQNPIEDNQIFPAVTQEQALINQNRVTVKALPFEKSDAEGSALWDKLLQWQYESGLAVPEKIIAGIIDAKTHGHWVTRLEWNPKARWDRRENRWVGEVAHRLRRPETVVFSDDTEDADHPPWVIEYDRMRLEDAQQEFPDFKDKLAELGEDDQVGEAARAIGGQGFIYEDQPGAAPGRSERGRLARLLSRRGDDERRQAEKFIIVQRIYFKDYATTKGEVPVTEFTDQELLDGMVARRDIDGKTLVHARTGEILDDENRPRVTEEGEVPKYPSYRYVARAGGHILKDEAWKFDEPPYAVGINMPLPGIWRGLNGVEMVKCLQDVQNQIAMNMEAWVALTCIPILKVAENAVQRCANLNGIRDELVIKRGAIWKMTQNGMNGVQFVQPPTMPATVPQVRESLMDSLRDATGVQEIGLGRQATGSTTATEAIRLETNTKLRTALQWKLVEIWILRVMRRAQAMCQEYWTPDEMRRIAGPASEGVAVRLTQEAFDARFDLRLEVTTTLPFDRERRKQEAVTLYQLINVPFLGALLDAFERDDKQDILEKVEAWQMILEMQKRAKEAQEQTQETIDGQSAGSPTGPGQATQKPAGPPSPTRQPAPVGA